jgi:hypothetical protein
MESLLYALFYSHLDGARVSWLLFVPFWRIIIMNSWDAHRDGVSVRMFCSFDSLGCFFRRRHVPKDASSSMHNKTNVRDIIRCYILVEGSVQPALVCSNPSSSCRIVSSHNIDIQAEATNSQQGGRSWTENQNGTAAVREEFFALIHSFPSWIILVVHHTPKRKMLWYKKTHVAIFCNHIIICLSSYIVMHD